MTPRQLPVTAPAVHEAPRSSTWHSLVCKQVPTSLLAKGGAVKCTTSGEDPSALSDMLVTVAVARLCVSPRCTSALPCTTGMLPTCVATLVLGDYPARCAAVDMHVCSTHEHSKDLLMP